MGRRRLAHRSKAPIDRGGRTSCDRPCQPTRGGVAVVVPHGADSADHGCTTSSRPCRGPHKQHPTHLPLDQGADVCRGPFGDRQRWGLRRGAANAPSGGTWRTFGSPTREILPSMYAAGFFALHRWWRDSLHKNPARSSTGTEEQDAALQMVRSIRVDEIVDQLILLVVLLPRGGGSAVARTRRARRHRDRMRRRSFEHDSLVARSLRTSTGRA